MFFGGVGVGFSDMMESKSKIFFRLHNPGFIQNEVNEKGQFYSLSFLISVAKYEKAVVGFLMILPSAV